MYDVFRASKPYLETIASSFDITTQQMFALRLVHREQPLQMSVLATQLGCDASNVTSIVDKLETRGLLARRSDDRDRRVKVLVPTAEGDRTYAEIEERMLVAPPAIENLSAHDQQSLCEILGRAVDSLAPVAVMAAER